MENDDMTQGSQSSPLCIQIIQRTEHRVKLPTEGKPELGVFDVVGVSLDTWGRAEHLHRLLRHQPLFHHFPGEATKQVQNIEPSSL